MKGNSTDIKILEVVSKLDNLRNEAQKIELQARDLQNDLCELQIKIYQILKQEEKIR